MEIYNTNLCDQLYLNYTFNKNTIITPIYSSFIDRDICFYKGDQKVFVIDKLAKDLFELTY